MGHRQLCSQHFSSPPGANEDCCTYPRFLTDNNGDLIFHYRDGSSGNGSEIYNRWDRAARRWVRMLDRPD